jgi:hypothetical protein
MSWPQVVFILLAAAEVGHALALDGKPKEYPYSFIWSAISWGILAFIVYMGGFFK